jgi:hypothetical protein
MLVNFFLTLLIAPLVLATGLFDNTNTFVSRAVVNGNICARIDLSLLGITVVKG